jgi:hypothetical protein
VLTVSRELGVSMRSWLLAISMEIEECPLLEATT